MGEVTVEVRPAVLLGRGGAGVVAGWAAFVVRRSLRVRGWAMPRGCCWSDGAVVGWATRVHVVRVKAAAVTAAGARGWLRLQVYLL